MPRSTRIACLLWLAISGAAQAQGGLPSVRVGDEWVYQVRDALLHDVRSTNTIRVTAVAPDRITVVRTSSVKAEPDTETYTADWAMIDTATWAFEPNSGTGGLATAAIGSTWRTRSLGRNKAQGFVVNADSVGRSLADERLSTEAGTFGTRKLEIVVRQVQG
jgi:hypothetical protein